MARITIKNLRHSYVANPRSEADWALKRLNLDLSDGGAYALLGPSGCGKTTLLNLISGLLRPTEGRILFDGRDVTDATPEARNIAQVFQFPVIYDTMTVYANLAFPLRNRGIPAKEADARVREIASMLEEHPALRLSIEGHTDSDGEDGFNKSLSERRAAAVKAYLVSQHAIDAARLETAGFGESAPVSSNDTPEGKQQNRRVDLVRLDR